MSEYLVNLMSDLKTAILWKDKCPYFTLHRYWAAVRGNDDCECWGSDTTKIGILLTFS